jgi:hypothetical protein
MEPNGTDAPWFSQGFDLYSDGLNWTRADLTGDGRLDLVVTDRDASVSAGPTTPMLGRSRWRLFTNHGEGFDEAGVEWSLPDYGNPPSEGDAWFGEGFDRYTDGLDWSLTDLTGDAVPDLVVTHRDASGRRRARYPAGGSFRLAGARGALRRLIATGRGG